MTQLLLSIDLEDVRDQIADGHARPERVPANTARYLAWFAENDVRATFFVVGDVARRYPELLREIAAAGHEIACHSDRHIQLNKQTPAQCAEDLRRNLDALDRAGIDRVTGYRAPTFSLTAASEWMYTTLAELGFEYSSSVLPAGNPLYGWPGFGEQPRRMAGAVWELPITLHPWPGLRVPLAGGVYFRVLPWFLIRLGVAVRARQNRPLLTYLHPYDLDEAQERFMHPDLNDNRWLNRLMYINRNKVLPRLQALRHGHKAMTYSEYVRELSAAA